MKKFKTLIEDVVGKKAIFTFARMNPPTRGHEFLLNCLLQTSKTVDATPFIFLSQTHDNKKNPLSFEEKIKYIDMSMPFATPYISKDKSIRTPFDAIAALGNAGYKDITMVVGSDRLQEFQSAVGKYVNHPDATLSLPITKFHAVSVGNRDSNATNLSGISSSKMREAAANNNFSIFKRGIPSQLSDRFAKQLFDTIRANLIGKNFSNETAE